MTENLKILLDGWWSTASFWVAVTAFVLWFVAPRSCEAACSTCPWDRDGARRLRYWTWRTRQAHLWVVWDVMIVFWAAGRVVTDVLLDEVAWTLPLIALFGVWVGREYLRDLRELDHVRARRAELQP